MVIMNKRAVSIICFCDAQGAKSLQYLKGVYTEEGMELEWNILDVSYAFFNLKFVP